MGIEDLLVGKSALSSFNQSLRLCTFSRPDKMQPITFRCCDESGQRKPDAQGCRKENPIFYPVEKVVAGECTVVRK